MATKKITLNELRTLVKQIIKEGLSITVSNMSLSDFEKKYIELAKYAKESEKKGKLDQHDSSYVPMTKDEELLLQSNWKEFSRRRGFSEDDINKYSEWLKISGQENSVVGAFNDPWRRGMLSGDDVNLDYIEYIYDSIKQAELTASKPH